MGSIDVALGLVAVLLLILANAFFVVGEFALVAVDRTKIEHLVKEGDARAKKLQRALRTLSFQLSGAQLGITISSLVLGFIAEGAIADVITPAIDAMGLPRGSAHAVALVVALALATAAQMVLGELIPKNLAIARPLPTALNVANKMRVVNALFKPLIVFLNATANLTVRALGIEPREELASVRSLDELDLLIRSSREHGALPEEHASLLARSISFGDKTAADALMPRTSVVALPKETTIAEMHRTALDTGFSRFPIFGEDIDDMLGVTHVKDGYRVRVEERDVTRVAEIVAQAPVVPLSRNLESLLLEMRRTRKQMAVVVDEYGGTAGIVTLEDILEEIVGEIEDEYDPSAHTRRLTSEKRIDVVSGMLHRDEVYEQTGFEMPEGDYDTLAGFLLTLFDRIPDTGDEISFRGWELKVVEMDGRRISQVLVVAPTEGAEERA